VVHIGVCAAISADQAGIPEAPGGIVQAALKAALRSVFSDPDDDRADRNTEARDNRILIAMPVDVSSVIVADLLPRRLAGELRRYGFPDAMPAVSVLLVLHAAEAEADTAAVDSALRIVNAAETALDSWQSGNVLDVITSDEFYRTVIVQDSAAERAVYRSVELPVDDQATQVWVRQADAADALLGWLDDLPPENQTAHNFLQFCAFLGDEPVPFDWFTNFGVAAGNLPELAAALQGGVDHGLVGVDEPANTVRVHRLLRAAMSDRMTAEQRSAARRDVHRWLAHLDPGDPRLPEDWPRYRKLLSHARTSELVGSDDVQSRALVINLMRYLYFRGDHQQAADFAARAWNAWGQRDEADPQSLEVASNRGLFLWALGRYAEAAEINQRTLAIRREVSGEGAPATILARLRVAVDVRTRGDFVAARDENREIHEQARARFAEDDPIVLQAAHDLAVVTRLCGDYRTALDLDTATWQLRDRVLGADNADTLNTRSGIYVDRRELGDYRTALDGHREVAGRLLALVDEDPPGVSPGSLLRHAHLAVALRRAGDYRGALDLSERTHQRMTSVFGSDHPVTLACAVSHATDLRYAGRTDEAHAVGERSRAGYRGVLPINHPLVLAADANHAVTLRLQGNPAAAQKLNQQARELLVKSLGASHPHAIACVINFASDLAELGNLEAAREIGAAAYERAVQAERALGADHPTTLTAGLNLALDQGVAGEPRYTEIVHRYQRTLGVEHPATLGAQARTRGNCDIDPLPM
jgi:tetratricopeptide (TPR) repeat protein